MLYRFGKFELDTDRFELRRHGAPLHIEHKVLDLLRYLIEHRARVVPRAELVRVLWPDTAVGPNSLNQALYTLRQCLGDQAGSPAFVRTIRGRGLQFVTEVRRGATGIPTATSHVGRDREMRVLAEALRKADIGAGAVCLAVGQAGIGKSRMLEEFARLAQASSLVRVGRCAEDEGRVAFRPWMQILRHESRDSTAAELAEVDRFSPGIRVGQSADSSNSAMPMEADAARFRWFEDLASFLVRRAALRTRVLLIDDLHRADRLSLEFFAFLAREISESRILLVGFARDGELYRSASRDLARAVVSRGGIELEIDALDRMQAQEFLAALGVSDGEDELYKRSGGNPLFLQQLARLRLEGASDADRLPDSLRRAALECLVGLRPETRAFLSAAAIEGKEFKLKRVCTALALSLSEGQIAINEAANAGVLEHDPISGRARFVHIVMREALVESLGSEAKRDLHRRFWTLQAGGESRTEESVARAAHHALEAGGRIAREYGVSLARTAAMTAMIVLDYFPSGNS